MRISDWSSDACSSDLIHQHIIVDVQLLPDQRRADDPRIVGEADDLTLRRPGDGDRDAARQAAALLALEILPCGLEARMILGMQRRRFAKRQAAPARNLCDRKARVGAADIDRDDGRAHDSPLRGPTPPLPQSVAAVAAARSEEHTSEL